MKKQRTILIAEVDRNVARKIKRHFEMHDYYIYPILTTGDDLLVQSKILQPSLIIADTRLNGTIDGIEAISRLEQEINIPYIFITRFDDDIRLIKSYYLKPVCLIQNPINLMNLNVSSDRVGVNFKYSESYHTV
ncbi:MAG: response regulator [Ignavibacteriaceae bacterium]|nr:response regulator [Ignavibacteriaceae bacterium]